MRSISIAGFCLLLLGTSPAHAQRPSAASAGVADTAVVRLLSPGLIRGLDNSIARLLFDSTPTPWSISIPDSTSSVWRDLSSSLFSLLRAREIAPTDTAHRYLDISPVVMKGDTLVARFSVGSRWRCPDGKWTGHSTGYELTAVRHGSSWEYPKTRPVLYGDGMCLYPPSSPA